MLVLQNLKTKLSRLTLIEALIGITIIFVVGAVIYANIQCLEWVETGGTVCYGDEYGTRCYPERRCVRWRE